MSRKMCALILALMMLLTAVALADDGAVRQSQPVDGNHPAVGAWQLEEYAFDGESYSAADVADMAETIELYADGSAAHSLYGESEAGQWTDADGVITLTTPTCVYRLNYDGRKLTFIDDYVSGGFIRDISSLNALHFDAAQAQSMCNLVNGGLFAIDGDRLIGLDWDADGRAMLATRALTNDSAVVGEAAVLDGGCLAGGINVDSGTIYYVRTGLDGDSGIYSVGVDGSGRRQLMAGEYGSLQLSGGRLYYTDAEQKLFSCATDGSDARQILNFAVCFPYVLSDEWLIYQSADDETLHVYRFIDGYDRALTERRSLLPMLKGGYLYFFEKPYASGSEKAERANICRIDMATLTTERAVGFSGAYLAFNSTHFFAADGGKLANEDAWWTIENSAYDGPEKAPVFANDEYLVSLLYEDGMASRVEVERLQDRAAVSFNS